MIEFVFDGDESAAAAYAFDVIYHPAFGEAVTTLGQARPRTMGASVDVLPLAANRAAQD